MIIHKTTLTLAALAGLIGTAVAQPVITDPDAANAPIPDRETADFKPKKFGQAPDLDALGVASTNYPIPAGAIFAAPGGKESATGFDRAAPTTLARAVASAPVGGTVVLLGGDYHGVSALKIPHQMTLQPAPGETAWIKGSILVTGFTPDGANFSAPWNLKFKHPSAQDIDTSNPIAGETDMVFVAGRTLGQAATLAELKPGQFFVDTVAKKLVLGADPRGKMVEATAAEMGLDIKDTANRGTKILGLGFAHYARRAIEDYAPQQTFENNTIAWNAAQGLSLHNVDHVLRGNTFACNGLNGLNAVFTDRLLFEQNRVLFNNIEKFRFTWSAAGTKIIVSQNMTLRNNLYEGNQGASMWFDISCSGVKIVGNTFRHNRGSSVFYELCHDGLIAFNVMQDNGAGIIISDSSSVRVWNNTFVNNAKAIVLKDTPRFNNIAKEEGFYPSAMKAKDIAAGVTWITANNDFHNNLFVGGRDAKSVFLDAGMMLPGKSSGEMLKSLDNNIYARTAPDVPRVLVRWNDNGKTEDYESLEAFRAAHPTYAANAMLLENSPFVGPDNYALAADSPLLKLGHELTPEVRALASDAGLKLPAGARFIGARGSVE